MPTTCEPTVGEGGVLCRRCGQLLDDNAVLVIIGDAIVRFCSTQHAADALTSTPAPTQSH